MVEVDTPLRDPITHDLVVCGGTLGIFVACALQLSGLKVAVIERGPLRGRQQEWNISKKELAELVEVCFRNGLNYYSTLSKKFKSLLRCHSMQLR